MNDAGIASVRSCYLRLGRKADTHVQATSNLRVSVDCATGELAEEAVRSGQADLVAFGKPFISNPDLVERLRQNAPLNPWDSSKFYGGGSEGYLDYPTLPKA